jgi:hypothetical protein
VPDALGQLRSRLAEQRRAGQPFEQAWPSALSQLPRGPWPWRPAVLATREAWRRAYLREPPTPHEQAVALALTALREWDAERAERERFEPLPGLPVPTSQLIRPPSNGSGRGARPKLPRKAA